MMTNRRTDIISEFPEMAVIFLYNLAAIIQKN